MDDKKLLFIVNPRAGKTKSLAPLLDAAAIYSEAGYLVSVRKTTHRGEATELAESLGPEFDVVVCHGGDGTLNEVVNGVIGCPNAAVTHYPGGSGNDAIKIFDAQAAYTSIERLLSAEEAQFDLVR